jgi:SAM-dependent methyltransferase
MGEEKTQTKPLLNDLNSEQTIGLIYTLDLLKDRYQKEIKKNMEESHSKTLYSIKCRIQEELVCSSKPIEWLDIGCGTGRCLNILGANPDEPIYSPSQLERIHYTGVDSSVENLYATEQLASRYNGLKFSLIHSNIEDLEGGTKYNLISAILVFHELSPNLIPNTLHTLINYLKDDGILFISDFMLPYELEKEIVVWDGDDLKNILTQMGYYNLDRHFIYEPFKTDKIPDEYGMFRLALTRAPFYVTLNNQYFNTNYYNYKFLEDKKRKIQTLIDQLKKNLEKKACLLFQEGSKSENAEKISQNCEKLDTSRILETIRKHNFSLDQLKEISGKFSDKEIYQMWKIMMLKDEIITIDRKLFQKNT